MTLSKRQQNLLRLLYAQFIIWDTDKSNKVPALSFDSICEKMNCTKSDLHFITASLFTEENLVYYSNKGVEGLMIKPNGIAAHSSNKYIAEKNARILNRVKDYLGITVSIIAILTAIVTTSISITSLFSNKKEINLLKERIEKLEKAKGSMH